MLTPSQYDQLADSLAELYAQLEESILQDMVRRMLKMGYLSDATEWQARMLQEAGMLYDDILAEIAQRTGSTQEQLRTVFQTAGIQAIRNDNYYYQQANVFTHRSMSDSALQVLNAGYVKCSGNLKNLTLTTANTSQQAFIQACNLAYMQVSSGMMDYNTAIRKAVQNAAKDGSTVLYPSGHKDKLDVAVRRAVLTGVGQTVRQVSFQNAKDLETDLMELTAHAGARPSHAEWQGQIVSLSGRKGYLTTQEIGYGSVDGFGGVNCRHDWHPYFEGLPRTYSPERLKELNEPHIQIGEKLYTDYEVSQMQRALERKIREKKRQVIAADALGDKNELQKQSVQLKQAEQNLKDFLNQTGFLNDSARLWVNGFGRSQAQKAVWANRKYQQIKNSTAPKSSGTPQNPLTNQAGSGIINTIGNLVSVLKNRILEFKNKIKDKFTPENHKQVSQNYLDSLPKLSKLESMEEALKATNPHGYIGNCQRCVPAYELRRRGYDVIAVDAPLDDTLGLSEFMKIFVDAKWIKCHGDGKQEILDFLKSCEDGARVEISIMTTKGSHLFCAEKGNGKIMFIDPQTGESDVDKYFNKIFIENTKFCRIDKLDFSNLIKICIEEA